MSRVVGDGGVRVSSIMVLALINAFVLLVTVNICTLPRRDFSRRRGEPLTDVPQFSVDSVTSNAFFTSLSTFCSSTLPLHARVVELGTTYRLTDNGVRGGNILFSHSKQLISHYRCRGSGVLRGGLRKLTSLLGSAPGDVYITIPQDISVCARDSSTGAILSAIRTDLKDSTLTSGLHTTTTSKRHICCGASRRLSISNTCVLCTRVIRSLNIAPCRESSLFTRAFYASFYKDVCSGNKLVYTRGSAMALLHCSNSASCAICYRSRNYALSSLCSFRTERRGSGCYMFASNGRKMLRMNSSDKRAHPSLLIVGSDFTGTILPLLTHRFSLIICSPQCASTPLSAYSCVTTIINVSALTAANEVF